VEKHLKRKSLSLTPKNEPGVAGPVHRMQQQLNAIERKLDMLINQRSVSPVEKNYSQKPYSRFNHPHRQDRERQDNYPEDRTYTLVTCADCKKECEVPFKPNGGRPTYCRECFLKHKKDSPYSTNRNDKRPKSFKKKESFFARKKKRV